MYGPGTWCDGSSLKRSGSFGPDLEDVLVGCETSQGVEPAGMIVGIQEELEMPRSWSWLS